MQTITITLNGREVSGNPGMTILELAQESNVQVPTLCYDPCLTSIGACRICIVEDERSGTLSAACVTPITPGMIINTELQMSEMLDRTGKDLGFEKKIYRNAVSIDFCSSVLSRKMTEEDPRRIVNCPFIVTVYVLPDEPGTTYVVHRRLGDPDEPGVMGEVASMLKAVSEAATAEW